MQLQVFTRVAPETMLSCVIVRCYSMTSSNVFVRDTGTSSLSHVTLKTISPSVYFLHSVDEPGITHTQDKPEAVLVSRWILPCLCHPVDCHLGTVTVSSH